MRKCDYCSKKFLGAGFILEHNNDTTTDFCSRNCFEKKFRGYALGVLEDIESSKPKNALTKRYNNTRKIFFRACLNDTPTEQLKKLKAPADNAMTDMLELLNDEVQAGIETEQEYLYTADFLKHRSRFMTIMIEVLGK